MVTWAPRCAARMASVPHPVPISSSRVPLRMPARSRIPSIFAQLCLLEPDRGLHGLALVEPRRGVGHRRVQEGGEQVVAQVVVSGDVAARTIKGVLLVMRDGPVGEDTQPLQGRRNQGGQPRDEGCQQVGQVGAGPGSPVPGHVGLTEPDLGVAAQPGEERRGANDLQFGRCRRPCAEHPAVGVGDADRDPPYGMVEDHPRDAGSERHRWCGGGGGPPDGGGDGHGQIPSCRMWCG